MCTGVRLLVLVSAALAGVGALAWSSALAGLTSPRALDDSAQTPAALVIDRTFVCALPLHAGDRRINIGASSALPGQRNYLGETARPYVVVTTGGVVGTDNGVLGMAGGRATRAFKVTLWVYLDRCRSSAKRPALTSRGLSGGATSPYADEYSCSTSRTVLVRVRGMFESPARLRATRSNFLGTSALLREGRAVVTTAAGRPVLYATVTATGKSTLFVGKDCFPG